jgi:hypothetical protein
MSPLIEQKKFQLVPEMVPSPLWGRSACKMLGNRAVWKKQIRGDALTCANNRCELCGSNEGRLYCHEKWEYDDKRGIATLVNFEIHCGMCDAATHPGLTFKVANSPAESLLSILEHLCKVNRCTMHEAQAILSNSTSQWEKRSAKKWTVRVSDPLVGQYPELKDLPDFIPPPAAYK